MMVDVLFFACWCLCFSGLVGGAFGVLVSWLERKDSE